VIYEVIASSHRSEMTSTCRGKKDREKGNAYTHENREMSDNAAA
jgi:hypothetical protein